MYAAKMCFRFGKVSQCRFGELMDFYSMELEAVDDLPVGLKEKYYATI